MHESKDNWGGCINIRQSRFQNKNITRDKQVWFIMIKEYIHKKNMCAPNNKTSKYIEQTLKKQNRRNRQDPNDSWRFQHFLISN